MKIGLFDSGIGGLTVLHTAMRMMPQETYLYYADTDHVPYGTKSVEEIRAYSDAAVAFLQAQGCDAVVIACNTATSAAAAYLRQKYTFPVIGIEPAVKPAVEHGGEKRILVVATPLTIREKKLHDLIDRVDERHKVDILALPELVSFAEQGVFESDAVRDYLAEKLGLLDPQVYGTLVFGCTHFNHFAPVFRRLLGKQIQMIDGSAGTVRHLMNRMQQLGHGTEGRLSVFYFQSGRPVSDAATLRFYERLLSHLDICEQA
ncbi:MAG: glutamate racemase [Lachnospiraceae bacterium]|nr:glutamate racemase [Lachnospiraceae bacterium]